MTKSSLVEDGPLKNGDRALSNEDDKHANVDDVHQSISTEDHTVEKLVIHQGLNDDDAPAIHAAMGFMMTNSALLTHADTSPEYVVSRVILPLEIHYHIIDAFDHRDEKGTIANCALTCRAWLPISRRKLYSYISFDSRRQWTAFKDIMLHSKSPSMPRCCGTVRELFVHPWNEPFFDAVEARSGSGIVLTKHQERSPWAHIILVQGAMRLTGLMKIELQGVDWNYLTPMALECGRHYHNLTSLSLRHCKFSNVLQFHQFITAFPALYDLGLYFVNFHSTNRSVRIAQAGHSLNSLHVQHNSDFMLILSNYLSTHSYLTQHLKDFEWYCEDHSEKTNEAWTVLIEAINIMHIENLTFFMPPLLQGACTDHSERGA